MPLAQLLPGPTSATFKLLDHKSIFKEIIMSLTLKWEVLVMMPADKQHLLDLTASTVNPVWMVLGRKYFASYIIGSRGKVSTDRP
jgi:hypothetical protein